MNRVILEKIQATEGIAYTAMIGKGKHTKQTLKKVGLQ
jgi:hypothetical protein